jgi:predicted  nucleic acid-binding Zn-ribbon protein
MASGANFKLGITASTNGVEEKLADVTKQSKQMGEAAQKSARDVQDQAAAFAEEVATSGNYKRELRSAMMEVQNLTVALRNMSDEERSSSVGQALAQRLQDAKNRAAELTDTITDLRTEVKNMASDSASFDAFK